MGKCNFKENKCASCKLGDDKECMYTMDYCKIAQQEGRCKQEMLKGNFRLIEVTMASKKMSLMCFSKKENFGPKSMAPQWRPQKWVTSSKPELLTTVLLNSQ